MFWERELTVTILFPLKMSRVSIHVLEVGLILKKFVQSQVLDTGETPLNDEGGQNDSMS